MSDSTNVEGKTEVEAQASAAVAPETNVNEQAESLVVRVHGKEFNVLDPIQKAQLEAWDEAHAKLVGRQSNELGALRQFKKEREPSKDESEVLKTAKQKAAEGDLDAAIELVFSQSKEAVAKAEALRRAESQNAELWEEYFAERPELAKKLGRKKIKEVSKSLNIFEENGDAFKTLDDYWLPLLPSEKPVSAKAETPAKPPVTLTGAGRKTPSSTKAAPASKPASVDDILNQHSVYFRK